MRCPFCSNDDTQVKEGAADAENKGTSDQSS